MKIFKVGRPKKASLNLSINAIVIIVIAFVVLSLGLTLTRTVFKAAMGKVPEAIAITTLEAEPTAENPITIPESVEIKRGATKTLDIGYYNKLPGANYNATLIISSCKASDSAAATSLTTDKLPTLTAISQDVGPSESKGYKVILTENELLGGYTYICTIAAQGSLGEETEQFFLQVTT